METQNEKIYILTEQIGCESKEKFNDLSEYKKLASQAKSVSAIKIWSGDVIDGIEFVYNEKVYDKGKSPFFHGGQYGNEKTFRLKKGDTLRKIRGWYDIYPESLDREQQDKIIIRKIQFETHGGDVSPMYGNECGKHLVSPKEFLIDVGNNNMICATYGTSWKKNMELHGYLNSIGFIFTEMYFQSKLMGVENNHIFDDWDNYKRLPVSSNTLKGIRLWWGDVIDCIEAVYDTEKHYQKGDSPFFHGGQKGDNYSYFKIADNDSLKKIICTYGSYPGTNDAPEIYILIKIQFETHNGVKSEVYGHFEKFKNIKEQKEYVAEVDANKAICAFYGYTLHNKNMSLYNFIRALGFYFK